MVRTLVLLAATLAVTSPAAGQDLTYWQDIRPVFRKHCTVCHSSRYRAKVDVSGGLALDTFEMAMKGTEHAVIRPRQSAKSVLIQYLTTGDVKKRMPLDADPLPKETIDRIRRWIDGGAKEGMRDTGDEPATVASKSKAPTRKLDVLVAAATKGKLALKVGPLAPIAAVAFSPDGKLLAAGSYGQVTVWDLENVRPVKRLTNVLGAVNDLKFSPDGKTLAVAGGQPSAKGDLRLYQVGDWKLLATLRGHDDVIFSVSFSPDGRRLVSASFDHTLRLWDVAARQSLRSYTNHSDFVYAAAFDPSGKRFASASKDRTVQLVDAETGKSVFTFSGMEQDVMAVAFSPDGKSIVSSGFEPALYWWNPMTGEKVKTLGGHGTAVHQLAFSQDGKRLVSAGADRTVRIWNATPGAALKTIPVGSSVYAVAISPSNKLVASGSFDGLVRLWDEATGRHLLTLLALPGEGEQADWLAVAPQGYAAGSADLVKGAVWRSGAQAWPAPRQPEMLARAARGETVPEPKIDKK
jgi:DNA-binding beta-propeller fold protein YncE